MTASAVFTEILKAKLETLLGMRGTKGKSALLWDDLNKIYDDAAAKAATTAAKAATTAIASLPAGAPALADTIGDINTAIADAIAAVDQVQQAADDITARHDTLVAGFVGNLSDAFDGVGGQISTIENALSSEIDNLTSTLENNYLTASSTNAAISASETTLSAQIDGLNRGGVGFQKTLLTVSDVTVGAAVTVTNAGAIGGQAGSIFVLEGATARSYAPPTNGASIVIPAERHLLFAGQRIKIGVLAKQASSNSATKFGVAYSCADGNSGYMAASENLTASLKWFYFHYTVPASAAGGDGRFAIFGDDSKTGKRTQIAKVFIEIAATVADVETLPQLSANVSAIMGAQVDNLAGTALAVLLNQLNVTSGTGESAWVEQTASALAGLQDNASAMWGVKLTAGSASTLISFVAADDPTGPVSTGVFEMDNLLIRADQVLIAPNNAFGDYDMSVDAAYSTDTGATYGFVGTSSKELGLRYLNISASADLETVYSDWFPVTPSTEYLVRAGAWLSTNTAGSGTSTVSVETGSVSSAGAVTVLTTSPIKTATDTTYSGGTAFNEVTLLTDATARRMRFRVDRAAGGTASGRAGGFRVVNKVGSSLVIDGGIKSHHIATGELRADHIGSGQITAGFLKIDAAMAVNDLDAGFSFGKTSPTDFSTDGLYLGRTLTNADTTGFGFLLGNTSLGGFIQSIQHTTDTGLKITNANFQFNAGSGTSSDITASQTVTLPVGTKTIDLSIVGGAGGGGAYNTTYTTSGGTTTVQLYDGSTNTGISWTAAGGLNGGRSSKVGQSSAYGSGGGGATWSRTWVGSPSNGDWSDVLSTSTPATGYGAGGGGGGGGSYDAPTYGKGGAAGTTKTVTSYDVSALANPKLVITIGAGGSTGANKSSAGTGGIVKIATSTIVSVPANVVPLRPTASGTFVKAANATGDTVFPDLGPGLWIISGVNSELLCLNQLRITDTGPISVKGANARSMTFVADIRPNIIVGNATAVTIVYAFYSMKVVT